MRGFRFILVLSILAAPLALPDRAGNAMDPVLRQYVDHEGFNWTYKQTAHFRLYFQADSEARRHVGALKRNVEAVRPFPRFS